MRGNVSELVAGFGWIGGGGGGGKLARGGGDGKSEAEHKNKMPHLPHFGQEIVFTSSSVSSTARSQPKLYNRDR